MKHLKDARKLLEQGDSAGALEILENILGLSPRNVEALRMKAFILDSWGRFDESLAMLHNIGKMVDTEEEPFEDLDKRLDEERESLIYSRLTPEGRWYFQFSPLQMVVSLFGLMGCFIFLITSPSYFDTPNSSAGLAMSFFTLVLLPWVVLLFLNFKGVKKILVGMQGIDVFFGIKRISYSWDQIGSAVIEYDTNLNEDYLKIIIYSRSTREALFNFDISRGNSVVRARRHFVRLLLSYIDTVSYVQRGKATDLNKEANSSSTNTAA